MNNDITRTIMTDQELFTAAQFAQQEILESTKQPHDNNYIARCWLNGFIRALKKSGYEVCLKKKDIEISF